MRLLSGRNVIITGASRGLGLHVAQAMWAHGANLLLAARSAPLLGDLRDKLTAYGQAEQTINSVSVDFKFPEAAGVVIDAARQVWTRLDGLVNNAGIIGPIGPAWENDWSDWRDTIQVNLLTPVALCRACVPWMKAGGGGKIINLSGGGATGPRPNFSAYATAKTGVVRFTEILAQETKAYNIQVNSIAPGALNTAMLQAVLEAGPEKAGPKEYAQSLTQVEKGGSDPMNAADLCVWLASSDSAGVTGKLISAVWDPWKDLPKRLPDLVDTDIYTLRRIVPGDRGKEWG
ncbi:MAG: SDR family oxidoreductase [Deltaproteobacteria bacterium]|nr:SDR family oxidoreductase [Deltaproteobacteria bacterium]